MKEEENVIAAFLDGYHDRMRRGLTDDEYNVYLAGLCVAVVDRYLEQDLLLDFNSDLATNGIKDCNIKHPLSRMQYLF